MLSSHLACKSGHHPPTIPLKLRDLEQLGFYSRNTQENPTRPGLCNLIRYVWNLLRLTDPLYYKLNTVQGFAINLVQYWKEAWQAYHLHILALAHIFPIVLLVTCLNASTPEEGLGKWICTQASRLLKLSSINSLINKCRWYFWRY